MQLVWHCRSWCAFGAASVQLGQLVCHCRSWCAFGAVNLQILQLVYNWLLASPDSSVYIYEAAIRLQRIREVTPCYGQKRLSVH